MTVVAVSNNNTRRQDMEGAYGAVNIGSGAGGGVDNDFFYEGAQTWGRKVGSTDARGISETITTIDATTAANRLLMAKMIVTNKAAINASGLNWYIGDAAPSGNAVVDAYRYMLADDGTLVDAVTGGVATRVYPIKGGWIVVAIDVNVAAWRDALIGSAPTLTAITDIATASGMTGTSKSDNIFFDAFDFSQGLWLVGGTSTDPDGTWDDFKAHDEDEGGSGSDGDRVGHVQTLEGVFYLFGLFTIGETDAGTDTDTVFTDSLKTLVFPGGLVAAGANAIEVELAQAATVVTMDNVSFVSRGRDDLTHFFDSSADQVDSANEEIDIVDHGLLTGEVVLYSDEGFTTLPSLTDLTEYYVRKIDADTISLHTGGRLDAHADTNQVGLTAQIIGFSHKLTRAPDTRFDVTFRGTSGSAVLTACVFTRPRIVTLTSAVTLTDCVLVAGKSIVTAGATLGGCSVADFVLAEGEAAVLCDDLADLTGCEFLRTDSLEQKGHAIEIDTAGTYAFNGNLFTGYGSVAEFDANAGVNGGTEVITTDDPHGFVDGEAVYYGDEGGTPVAGLTDGDRYYVNNITATTLSLHSTRADAEADNARVGLTAGSTEQHHLYSAHCEVLNSSGGLVTINVGASGDSPKVRNTPGSTSAVNNTVTHTLTGIQEDSEVTYVRQSDGVVVFHVENVTVSGETAYAYNYGGDVDVDIFIHHLSFKWQSIDDVTLGNTDAAIPVQQIADAVYLNP